MSDYFIEKSDLVISLRTEIKFLKTQLSEAKKESENCKLVKECAIEELSAANTKLEEMT